MPIPSNNSICQTSSSTKSSFSYNETCESHKKFTCLGLIRGKNIQKERKERKVNIDWKHLQRVFINVLKTGPDRPVRLSIGHHSGPIRSFGPDWDWTGVEPLEPAVQMILIFFKKKLQNENIILSLMEGFHRI